MILDLAEPEQEVVENLAADQAAELLEGDGESTAGDDLDTNAPQNEAEPALRECKPGETPTVEIVVTTDQPISEETKQEIIDQVGLLATGTDPDPLPLTDQQIAKQKAEADFRERIERLSRNVTQCALAWTAAKDQAKFAKKMFDEAIEMLTNATDQGPCYMPLFDRNAPAEPASELDVDVSAPAEPAEPEPDPNAWRAPSVNEIGLKPKLAETLLEAGIETIGMLEDLRADISQGRKKWPKGIGAAKVTQIEDAVINWLSKNRDRAAIENAADDGEESAAAISARMDQINIGKPGCLDVKHPDGDKFWDSGADAFKRGLELVECPYVPGPEQDDWLRGWAGQKVMEKYETKGEGEADSEPEPEPTVDTASATGPQSTNLDDL